jgi:uncharacterized membrane protein
MAQSAGRIVPEADLRMNRWGPILQRYRLAFITFSPFFLLLALIVFLPPDGKTRAEWMQFIGRFHPLTVHFPIALILLVPVLEVAGLSERFSYLRLSTQFVLGFATLTAYFAVFLGWCLARSGSYSGDLVTQHMWGGITLAAICWFCWALRGQVDRAQTRKFYAAALILGTVIVSWTGYRGGQISQGEEHLTEYMPSLLRHAIGLSDRAPLLQAAPSSFYALRVQPIFAEHCVTCHGPQKQKSNLRLDSYGWLLRGGKHGAVLKFGNAQGSDLFRRVALSPESDDFMPKEKRQPLPSDQLKMIELWINAGASGTLPVEAIKGVSTGVPLAHAPIEVSFPEIESAIVTKAREAIASEVAQLQSRFPNILNYESRDSAELVLNASLLGLSFGDSEMEAIAPLAGHITIADFSRTAITDRSASMISAMKHLRLLRLAHTKVTDTTLNALNGLDELQSLNVFGTGVTSAVLPSLQKFPKLERFYAGQTGIHSGTSVPEAVKAKLVL